MRDITFPFLFQENFEDLANILHSELRESFKHHRIALSQNGYVFFQLYDLKAGKVFYPYTGNFKFYKESAARVEEKIRDTISTHDTTRQQNVIEDVVLHMIWETLYGSSTRFESEFLSTLEPSIKQTILKCTKPCISSKDLVEQVQLSLRECLREFHQPLSIGFAKKYFGSPTKKIRGENDISTAQISFLSGHPLQPDGRSIPHDTLVYQIITGIEKYFFVGGFQPCEGKSFVRFADLLVHGQRVGYFFIIEKWLNESELGNKTELAENFLRSRRGWIESSLKDFREQRFLAEVKKQIQEPRVLTDQDFVEALQQHLPMILNTSNATFQKGNPVPHRLEVFESGDKKYLKIPIRIALRRGSSRRSAELGNIVAEMNNIDIDGTPDLLRAGLLRNGKETRESFGFLRSLSTAFELFELNRDLQKIEEHRVRAQLAGIGSHVLNRVTSLLALSREVQNPEDAKDKILRYFLAEYQHSFFLMTTQTDKLKVLLKTDHQFDVSDELNTSDLISYYFWKNLIFSNRLWFVDNRFEPLIQFLRDYQTMISKYEQRAESKMEFGYFPVRVPSELKAGYPYASLTISSIPITKMRIRREKIFFAFFDSLMNELFYNAIKEIGELCNAFSIQPKTPYEIKCSISLDNQNVLFFLSNMAQNSSKLPSITLNKSRSQFDFAMLHPVEKLPKEQEQKVGYGLEGMKLVADLLGGDFRVGARKESNETWEFLCAFRLPRKLMGV